MIKNAKGLKIFENNLTKRTKSGYLQNVEIVNALLMYAIKLKKFPSKNKLDGIEVDIRFARAINNV
ncbi:MAG: hypothetical protein QME52_02475 [Bacteroidota bacterium]|nr:hypothetical protein [Bacteroidota bacterium]